MRSHMALEHVLIVSSRWTTGPNLQSSYAVLIVLYYLPSDLYLPLTASFKELVSVYAVSEEQRCDFQPNRNIPVLLNQDTG